MKTEKKDPEERSPKENVFHDYQLRKPETEITVTDLTANIQKGEQDRPPGRPRKNRPGAGKLRTYGRAGKAEKEIASTPTPLIKQKPLIDKKGDKNNDKE